MGQKFVNIIGLWLLRVVLQMVNKVSGEPDA